MITASKPRAKSRIFVSYRREETAGYVRALFDRLRGRFGDEIFMDVESLREPGVDFVDAIERAVGSCDAEVVLIGKQWLAITDTDGRRRLDDPHDWVRVEVAAGLKRKILVIPVLVQGARMPRAEDLPEPLSGLWRIQALELSDARWDYDVGVLLETLSHKLGVGPPPPTPRISTDNGPAPTPSADKTKKRNWRRWAVGGAVVLGLYLLVAAYNPTPPGPDGQTEPPTSSAAQTTANTLVNLRPEQVIMPPEQLPLSGYRVDRDGPIGAGWGRNFATTVRTSDYYWVYFFVEILPSTDAALAAIAAEQSCTYQGAGGETLVAASRVSAPPIGDAAAACRFTFSGGSRTFFYATSSRNVGIAVSANVISSLSDTAALNEVISLARAQLGIIDRAAPR